jgi:hypothetical protein
MSILLLRGRMHNNKQHTMVLAVEPQHFSFSIHFRSGGAALQAFIYLFAQGLSTHTIENHYGD